MYIEKLQEWGVESESKLLNEDKTGGSNWKITLKGRKTRKFRYFQGGYHRVWSSKQAPYNGVLYSAGPLVNKPAPRPINNTVYEHERYKACTIPAQPEIERLMECLIDDAKGVLGKSWKEFGEDMGGSDSLINKRAYKEAIKNTNKLIGVVGIDRFFELFRLNANY